MSPHIRLGHLRDGRGCIADILRHQVEEPSQEGLQLHLDTSLQVGWIPDVPACRHLRPCVVVGEKAAGQAARVRGAWACRQCVPPHPSSWASTSLLPLSPQHQSNAPRQVPIRRHRGTVHAPTISARGPHDTKRLRASRISNGGLESRIF